MNIGLNEDDYTYLCTDIDFIIHAAAAVNLAYPYSVSVVLHLYNPYAPRESYTFITRTPLGSRTPL